MGQTQHPAALTKQGTEEGPSGNRRRSWIRLLLATLVALWMALAAMPSGPAPSGSGLDPSWVLGLSMAHAQGLVHGKDIIWTYGPLAFLSLPDSTTGPMAWTLAYHLGLYCLWAVALVRLALCVRNQAPILSVFLVGIVAIVDPALTGDHLELAIFTFTALALLETGYWRLTGLVLLALLAAAALLVKVSLGIQAALMYFAVLTSLFLFREWRSKAQILAVAACLPLFAFALYWVSTGSPGSFFSYIRYGVNIASGYSGSMGISGPVSQAIIALTSLALLFLLLPLLAKSIREPALAFAPAAASAFFLFKNAMVRQDGHAAFFQVRLALAAVFFLVTVPTFRYRCALAGFQVASILVGYSYISQVWTNTGFFVRQRLALQVGIPSRALLQWPKTWNTLKGQSEAALSQLRLGPEFADAIGKGSVEAVPWEVAQVEANHWTWRPRPIFQSYAAYTPVLDRISAEHSERSGADFLLVTWQSIDGRHLFFEDPLSWRALLDRYRSDVGDGATLLMRRSPESRFQGQEEIASSLTHWNVKTAVPQGRAPLILSADVRKSLYGKAASFFYRLAPVWIEVARRSGRTERYRTVPDNLANAVMINALPRSLVELNLFGRPDCMPVDPIVSLQLTTSDLKEFQGEIPLRWAHLRTRALPEESGPCVVAEASRKEFPSWGGAGQLTIAAGDGQPWKVESTADWLSVAPGPTEATSIDFGLRTNTSTESRRATLSAGGITISITQAGISWETVPRTIQLGLFRPNNAPGPEEPAFTSTYKTLVDCATTFGLPGDQPVMGDWTGNGVVRMGVFRKGWWYLESTDL